MGEAHEKPIYWGKLPKKGRLGQFADLMEGLAKIRGGGDVFEGKVATSMHTMYTSVVSQIMILLTPQFEQSCGQS